MATTDKRTEEKSFLKYGEQIILASFQQNLYLANRGLSFQAGIIAKCKREETINKFYLYPNLHEIIFEIHPNLNYESLMEFTECSNNDPNKDILEKRMILEANLNHAKIEENRGKFVKLGSVVQLYHPNSKTYLSFSTQKVGKSEMSAIGCTSETNESVQFTITSPFDFLKEGSLISYDDKFLFTDAYNKTLAYPISKEELEMTTLKLETKLERGLLNFFGGGSKEKEFKIPSIIENQKLFQGHFAGAVNEKSIGIQYSNQFEAINIENSYEKNELKENDLRWGDLVNIRKVDNSGKYSLMVAEVNKSSFGHNVIYRTFNQDSSSKMVNLESQFEIIHLNMRARGSTITFDKFNTVKVLLKHVLSGKFLAVDPETKKLILGKDYEDEYENLKNEKYKLESEYQSQYNAYMKIKESKRYDDITKKDAPHMTQADIDFFQSHGKEFIQSNKDYFKAYIMQRAFILEKVSSDESLHLNNSTFIKIRTFNNKSISIVSDLEHLNFVNENTRRKENNENFENNFFEELGDSIQQETLQVSDNCDIFHFEKNDKNMVRRFNRLNSYTAFLASVICMSDMKQSTTLQYLSVVDKIESILQSLITKKKLLKHTAQFLMVQMSTVDLLMDYLIKVRSFSKDSDDHMRLITDACASTISLLNLICENNPLVCTYLFQWRKFFTVSIVKVDNQVFKQINIDSLLFKIVDILKCYSIYIDDYLSNLCSSIKFENLDIRKLTVLLQITKNFLNLHDPVSVDKVFEKIFNPAHKSDIFKKLEYDEHDAHKIRFLGKEGHINVDEHFKDNEMIYRYFLQILNLVINLGELDAAKTAKNLHQNFPKEVCIYIFSDQENRYPGELRAAFLKLFALLYIVNLFQNNSLITYEEHITAAKIRGDLRKSSETLKTLQTLKESDENKKFMSSLLNNLTSSNNELALASLQTFNLLLGFKFFDEEYITNIKKNLDGLIVGENKRLKAEEPYRRDHRKDQKKGSAPPHKMESFVFEDRFVTRPDGPAFSIDDPTTLIEVVEMLTKLHRSAVRNKVLQVISEDKKLMQSEVSPKGAPNPEKNLTKEEIAFNRAYSSELAAINEGNEDVWRVITQWIKLKDSKLTSSILKYIFESSLMKHFFIEKYTEFFQVEADEDSSIYTRVRAYLRNFSDQLRDLMSEYSTSDSKTIRARSSSLFREYQALFDYFFIVMHPNDRQTKFELSIKDHNRQSPNDLLDLSSQDVFMNLLNMFLMDCKYLKSKQTIIYKSGLLEIVMKTAICFNTKIFVSFPRLEIEPVEKSRFSILPEFETKDYFKDEINCIILLILYFSLVTNPQNISFLMKNYRQDFQEFLLSSLRAQNQVVKRIAICLLIEVYKNNIEDLLNLRNDDKLFFQALLKQVQTEIDTKNYSILVNYIEFFAVATQFNSAILEENAKDIFNCLFDENLQDSNTVSHLISKDIPDEIKAYTTIQNQATKLDISKTKSGIIFNEEQQDLDEMDERSNIFSVLELSDRMLFISDLLGLLAGFGKNCSADFKNKIQKKLSMNTLIEIASSCKFNYYLKTTLIEVLSNIYITTKVDQNSKSFVLELISSIFSSDLKEYFKSQSNSLTSKDVFFINSTPRANCMLLESGKKGAAWNMTVYKSDPLFWKYVCDHLAKLIYKFVTVCANENNLNILEALYTSIEDLAELKEKLSRMYKTFADENQPTYYDYSQRPIELSASISKKSLVMEQIDQTPFQNSPPGFTPQKKMKFASPKRTLTKMESTGEKHMKTETMETLNAEFESMDDFIFHFKMRLEEIVKYFEDRKKMLSKAPKHQSSYFLMLASNQEVKVKDFERERESRTTFYEKLIESILVCSTPLEKHKHSKTQTARKKRYNLSDSPVHKAFALSSMQSLPPSPMNGSPREKYIDNHNISPQNKVITLQEAQREMNFLLKPEPQSPLTSIKDISKPTNMNKDQERLEQSHHSPGDSEKEISFHARPLPIETLPELPPVRVNLISDKHLKVGLLKISIKSEKGQSYLDFDRLKESFLAMAEVLQNSSVDITEACQIIDFFSYCLDRPLVKSHLLGVMQETTVARSAVLLISAARHSIEHLTSIVGLLNKLIREDLQYQKECTELICQDVDNKLLNTYFATLGDYFSRFFEVEEADAQMVAAKDQEEGEGRYGDLSEEATTMKERFVAKVADIGGWLVKGTCELLAFAQLLCLHHNAQMQNFMRLQSHKGQFRPMQVNVFERLRDMLKTYLKVMRPKNLQILASIFTVLATLVEGPCKENQHEVVSKKIMGVMDEAYNNLYQMTEKQNEELKSKAMLMYLRLKLGIIEGTSDSYIIKSIGLSFSSEQLLSRVEQIYCGLFGLRSFTSQLNRSTFKTNEIAEEILQHMPSFGRSNTSLLTTNNTASEQKMEKKLSMISSKLYSGRNYSTLVREGLYIIIWINQLCEVDKSLVRSLKTTQEEMERQMKHLKAAIKFFQDKVTSVEIINSSGNLQTLFFFTHPITRFLSSHTKSTFEYEIDRRSWNAKLLGLTHGVESLYTEMRHFERIFRWIGIRVNLSFLQYLKIASFVIALVINIAITFSSELTQELEGQPIFRSWSQENQVEQFVYVGGCVLLIIYLVILLLWFLFEFSVKKNLFYVESIKKYQARLAEHKLLKNNQVSKNRTIWLKTRMIAKVYWKLLVKTRLWTIIFYTFCCILGLSTSKFYFSFLLLDIINLSPMVKSVIKSLTLNSYLLGGTALFALILLFIYTSFTYYYADVLITNLRTLDQPYVVFCESFLMCYLDMITFGLRLGGGIGDILELPPTHDIGAFVFRQFFDIIFFVTVILLLMNIVIGIIVDSFAELRDLREKIGSLC
jgi:hypothetical protein